MCHWAHFGKSPLTPLFQRGESNQTIGKNQRTLGHCMARASKLFSRCLFKGGTLPEGLTQCCREKKWIGAQEDFASMQKTDCENSQV